MRHRALVLLAAALAYGLGACARIGPAGAPPASNSLLVFAASSLTDAFHALAAEFEAAHPGVHVVLNYGPSQALRAQIQEGGQADVFASANTAEVRALSEAGLVDEDSARTFASNRLVVVLPPDNPAGLASLRDLARPGVRLIVADPAVPAGQYTLRALEALAADAAWGAGFRDAFLANVVSQEETVRAVVAKVELGEADAGVVYTSDASHAAQLLRLELPVQHNPLADYPIVRLRQSPHASLAQAFIDFALSAAGQRILETHGFLPAAD